MTTLTLHNIDDKINACLQINAAKHNCTIEDEINRILKRALLPDKTQKKLGSRLHQQIIALTNGVELELPKRSQPRLAPDFSENTQ